MCIRDRDSGVSNAGSAPIVEEVTDTVTYAESDKTETGTKTTYTAKLSLSLIHISGAGVAVGRLNGVTPAANAPRPMLAVSATAVPPAASLYLSLIHI